MSTYHPQPGKPIPPDVWGRDHWSTFAYIETRCVDHNGEPAKQHVQANKNRHPHHLQSHLGLDLDGAKYPIRLRDGFEIPGPEYDEWDCIDDMIAAGLLEGIGTGLYPVYRLTDLGKTVAGLLRGHKSDGGTFSTFRWQPAGEEAA